jgi:RNA polymerase sigma-70 factor (ECF subfamily)
MGTEQTTAAIQRFLSDLGGAGGSSPAEPIVRDLLERAVGRLRVLCAAMLYRSYPRLARPPLNLEVDEMLSSVVARLLRALGEVRPQNVRQFFGLATKHMRWELNDLARSLDERSRAVIDEDLVVAPAASTAGLSPNARRILDAIESLPEDEREVFDLVRIQGMTHDEAAQLVGVSCKTIQRRLRRSSVLLTASLGDLQGSDAAPPA